MTLYLILFSIIVFSCIALDKVSNKLGIPALLAFLILGLFVGWAQTPERADYPIFEGISNIALLLIIFYGGFGARWKSVKPYVAEASLLASVGVIVTVVITTLGCRYLLNMKWIEALLISAIIGSTDAASVFSILRTKKLNLKKGTTPILEMESGSNDPFAYILTILVLDIIAMLDSGAVSVPIGSVLIMLLKQVGFGLAFGFGLGYAVKKFLERHPMSSGSLDSIYIMAVALIAYALPGLVDGNGFLSVYIVGVILGNSHIQAKKELVHFFDGIVTLVQMLLFFMLGLLAIPSTMLDALLPAVVILLVMTFISRPVSVFSVLSFFRTKGNIKKPKYSVNQLSFISFVGLRGAASIVFVIMALSNNEKIGVDIYNIVFLIVIMSISIQGSLIPWASKLMKMIDNHEDVSTNFNDFSEGTDMIFGKIKVTRDSSWCGMKIADLDLPKNMILVMVLRNDKKILPKGRVLLQEDDEVIAGLKSWELEQGVELTQHKLLGSSKLDGVLVKDMPSHHDNVILMIDRNGEQIIPTGKTVLHNDDTLFMIKLQPGVTKVMFEQE